MCAAVLPDLREDRRMHSRRGVVSVIGKPGRRQVEVLKGYS